MARVLIPTGVFVHILVEDRGRYLLVQEAKPEIGCPWCYPDVDLCRIYWSNRGNGQGD